MRAGAALILALCPFYLSAPATAGGVPAACIGGIVGAMYNSRTDRYPHGALGDTQEWARLSVFLRLTPPCRAGRAGTGATLPEQLVFEDVKPLLADLDGDGEPEILTVESHRDQGARLAIWGLRFGQLSRLAATPFIGTRFRWLAQLGAADLDGDGAVEIAYIDRPHLAKTLRIWRYETGALSHVADAPGLSNHRFGDPTISGGIRDCGTGPEIVTANADWSRLMASRLTGGTIESRDIGGDTSGEGFAAALACR